MIFLANSIAATHTYYEATHTHQYSCRDYHIKKAFDKSQGYPHGRKGMIVDHICALANGGIDSITNMQYQTPIESKKKDLIENTPLGKKLYCNSSNSSAYRTVFNCK